MANRSKCYCSRKMQSCHASKILFKSLPSPVGKVWVSSCQKQNSKPQIQKPTKTLKDPILGAFLYELMLLCGLFISINLGICFLYIVLIKQCKNM